jgi:hypothetical protein
MVWLDLRLSRSRSASGDLVVRFGVPVLDEFLEFLSVRSRPNTVTAVAYDLKVFFTVVGKAPAAVVAADVLAFVTAQYTGGVGGPVAAGGRRRGRGVGADGAPAVVERVGPVRVPAGPWRCGGQPGTARVADAAGAASPAAGCAVGGGF